MWNKFIDCLLDAGIDSIKLLPFLFLAYVVMEYIEHKMGAKAKATVERAGRFGPLVGGLLGIVPQCGFSTIAANLYAGRIITVGTLMAVFLSTSDEMLPIFISEAVPVTTIVKILGIKCMVAVVMGLLIDVLVRCIRKAPKEDMMSGHLCEHDHCHCEEGSLFRSALIHTIKITIFIFLISIVLNIVIVAVGEDMLKEVIGSKWVIASFAAGLVGLLPNCAASVVITELYLEQVISAGAMFSGLLVSAGVGLLVLFRVNHEHRMENIRILIVLYGIGVAMGSLLDVLLPVLGVQL